MDWTKTANRKAAGNKGHAIAHKKGKGGVGYPIESKKDAQDAATLLKMHGHKYSPAKRAKIKAHIRRHAKRVGATVNLADTPNIQTAKPQPVAKQPMPGQVPPHQIGQMMPVGPVGHDPRKFMQTANNLQIGQSFALPTAMAKVKRLGSGYQLYTVDGKTNRVVKTLPEVHTWIKKQVEIENKEVQKDHDDRQPSVGQLQNPAIGGGRPPVLEANHSNGQGNRLRQPQTQVQPASSRATEK